MQSMPANRRRLVIVSNRLPFSIAVSNGEPEFRETTGGLVTGLASYLSTVGTDPDAPAEYVWVGWPGSTIAPEAQRGITERAAKLHRSVPVFLSESDMEMFYLGFCNKTIWPLFHSFPSLTVYDEAMWQTYKTVNERFCDAMLGILKPDDLVWIHDYHLMLLPRLLKERQSSAQIGFFLHIPFPSYEIFRLLPSTWRKEVLEGVLGADLVGFHTYEYTQHFLQSVLRITGNGNTLGQILLPERVVRADTFPMGIDYERYAGASSSPEVQAEVAQLRSSLGDSRIVLSVDRLDYTKGIANRLLGYDLFLEANPQWLGKIVLIIVVVPSRIGVEQYDKMKRQLEELVGRINGKYGKIGWMPVVYQYRHVPFLPLVALYAVSDVAMVTPLRDGMNLVAKEYIAARTGGSGVLILSEMAGSAKELGEAVLVNPNHCGEIAAAIGTALNLPPEEQARRLRIMQSRLRHYTVHRWADDFVQGILVTAETKRTFETHDLSAAARRSLLAEYRKSTRRLLLLDYDGTLVPFVSDRSTARPGPRVLSLLHLLSADPANQVAIVSGRDREWLETLFGDLPIHLVAEHGFLSRRRGEEWRSMKVISGDWKRRLLPMLKLFADRLPGAAIEEKDYSLVWHYRGADPEQAELFAHELADNLNALTGNVDIQVMQANKAIEIRVAGINKGTAAEEIMAAGEYEFILAIGDDRTDEDLFAVLPEHAWTIKVGTAHSRAKYNCAGVQEVLDLLGVLAGSSRERTTHPGAVTRAIRFVEHLTAKLAGK
ncbi:MAG TPA: bifunctional alpha,alpha-trehalose-phosphate synthase (UDP-forming)/trehalose-phosphatase [Bacteroidota bacterium]|nr:bifunctional alpha,alpha-trehalose-phosphate synthase (UDP-forming)/trehalose-phosphatase [Bacteroidota bacterium]